MRGNAMRREDTGDVVEMLRPQKRSTGRHGKQIGRAHV